MQKTTTANRVDGVDVLRGIAILGILLLHCIEHYNLFEYPEPSGVAGTFFDQVFWRSLFFVFGGKAYAIFALLFGFSFFIQDNNQLQKGKDFRLRFVWRLAMLLGWGMLNTVFYNGDVLVMFAVVGLCLPVVARFPDKAVFWIAVVLMLQPLAWGQVAAGIVNPSTEAVASPYMAHYRELVPVLSGGNFAQTVLANLCHGQPYSIMWAAENGRLFQIAALFMLGMLAGRRRLFSDEWGNSRLWAGAAILSIVCFLPLEGLLDLVPEHIKNVAVLTPLKLILKSLSAFSFMVFLVSLVLLLYYRTKAAGVLGKLRVYGRMSLTMYITQSMLGSFVFYNWGLGLAKKLSITHSVFVALIIFAIQYAFACFWFGRHCQGPLEYLWKKATWIGGRREKQ